MGTEADEDYSNFDPKEFWAKKNNLEKDLSLVEKKYKEKLNKILDAMTDQPVRNIEISEMLGIRQGSVNQLLWNLKEMGCKIETIKSKNMTHYLLKYRPNVLVKPKKPKR